MTTIPAVPSHRLAIDWGELTASCDHPHRVRFHAGTDGTPLLPMDDIGYVCDLVAHRDGPGDPNPRQRIPLQSDWYALAADAWLALSHTNGVAAVTRHQQTFINAVLPELATWLDTTTEAARLVAAGTVYWRRQCATWAASTETDINRALHRVRSIRDAIAAGQIPTDDAERYLRHARVHPR
jgi:hypothetical protein